MFVFFNKYYENAKITDHRFLGEVSYAGNLANQPMQLKGIVSGNFDQKFKLYLAKHSKQFDETP